MNNKSHFSQIVKHEQINHENSEHVSVGYIDDVSHIVGLDTKEELEFDIQQTYQKVTNCGHRLFDLNALHMSKCFLGSKIFNPPKVT